MINCELVKPSALLASDEAVWRQMCAATQVFGSPILSPDFCKAVSEVRDDVFVAIFRDGATPIAFLAHHRRPNNFARPTGAPFSDYSALITFADPKITMAQALELAHIDKFQAIGLLDPHEVCGELSGEIETSYGLCLRSELPMNTLSKKHRKNVNRLHRHLEEKIGPVQFIFDDQSRENFDKMIALKRAQTRQTGIHDFLSPPWVVQLMENLRNADRSGLHGCMVTLKAGDAAINFQFGLRLNDRMHPWIATFDPEYAGFSPGQIFMMECPPMLIENSINYYDLSTGHQHYKSNLTNNSFEVRHQALLRTGLQSTQSKAKISNGKIANIRQKLSRRIDQIATLELDNIGRLKGVLYAFANAGKRLGNSAKGE